MSETETTLDSLQTDLDALRHEFILAVVIIGVLLFLVLVLAIILYCWMYTLEKKFKEQYQGNNTVDFKIKRAQIREEYPTTSTKPLSVSQNPLAKSGNFEAVVDDLKRSSNGPNSSQTKYPNYIADNKNFDY